jgi:hypothetical protein
MTLYNIKSHRDHFIITKFDADLEVEASYELKDNDCSCPAGIHGKYCRHKEMLPIFQVAGRVDKGWFYDHKFGVWYCFDFANCKMFTESELKPKWRRL